MVPSEFDNQRVYFMSKFLSEVTLLEKGALKFKPSLLATCVVVYSQRLLLQRTHWAPEFANITGYEWAELRECVFFVHDSHVRIDNAHQMLRVIPARYSKTETGSVALVSPPSSGPGMYWAGLF